MTGWIRVLTFLYLLPVIGGATAFVLLVAQ